MSRRLTWSKFATVKVQCTRFNVSLIYCYERKHRFLCNIKLEVSLCIFCIINYTIAINLLELYDSNGCSRVPDQVKYFELVKEQLEGEL